jgi:hypothetical protein
MLLVVDQEVDPRAAAEITGAPATRHTGTVSIVPTMTHGRRLRRSP